MMQLKDIFTRIESLVDSKLATSNLSDPTRDPLFIITCITTPRVKYSHNNKHLYSVASSAVTKIFPNPFAGNLNTVFKRLKIFGVKNLHIFIVFWDNETFIEKINLERFKIYNKNINYKFNITVISTGFLFYDRGPLQTLVTEKVLKDTIFVFCKMSYNEIVGNFKQINVILSGGPVNKRHLLSPIQCRLHTFIAACDINIIESFHYDDEKNFPLEDFDNSVAKLETRVKDDFTLKIEDFVIPGIEPFEQEKKGTTKVKDNNPITQNAPNSLSKPSHTSLESSIGSVQKRESSILLLLNLIT
jgi:hypothetical protein